MSFFIERIVNKPINSNCFIIYKKDNKNCIIIDPGTEDCQELLDFIQNKKLIPQYIFLTHEHFDHIWGVNKLKLLFDCKIVCSLTCSESIVNKKKNMSVFYDQIGFETPKADITLKNIEDKIIWNELEFIFYQTKGHSEASICILLENFLFAGDTIIKNHKTVTKLPTGNKANLQETLINLENKFFGKQIFVHAGHEESFWFDEVKNQNFI